MRNVDAAVMRPAMARDNLHWSIFRKSGFLQENATKHKSYRLIMSATAAATCFGVR
jgi:hypothetical protein